MTQPNTNTPEQSASEMPESVLQKIIAEADASFDEDPNDFKDNWIEGAKWSYRHLRSQPIPSLRWVKKDEFTFPVHRPFFARRTDNEARAAVTLSGLKLLDGYDEVWGYTTDPDIEYLEEESPLPVQPANVFELTEERFNWLIKRGRDEITLGSRIPSFEEYVKHEGLFGQPSIEPSIDQKELLDLLRAQIAVYEGLVYRFEAEDRDKYLNMPSYLKSCEMLDGYPSIEPDAPVNDGWISVENKPPEVGEYVALLLNAYEDDEPTWLKGRRLHDGWSAFYADGEHSLQDEWRPVTHWMPIPKSPINVTN